MGDLFVYNTLNSVMCVTKYVSKRAYLIVDSTWLDLNRSKHAGYNKEKKKRELVYFSFKSATKIAY